MILLLFWSVLKTNYVSDDLSQRVPKLYAYVSLHLFSPFHVIVNWLFSCVLKRGKKFYTQQRWLGCRINTNLVALRKSNKQESKSGASDRKRFASKKSAESSPVAASGGAERQFFFFNYASGYDLVGAVWQIRRRSHPIHRITKSAETAG